jgi:hypothetical protein
MNSSKHTLNQEHNIEVAQQQNHLSLYKSETVKTAPFQNTKTVFYFSGLKMLKITKLRDFYIQYLMKSRRK